MEERYSIQEEIMDPIAIVAKAEKDTIYFQQYMQQPDKAEFSGKSSEKSTATTIRITVR